MTAPEVGFQFFPSCCIKVGRTVIEKPKFIFQFFPSCCLDGEAEVPPLRAQVFQFFPSCCARVQHPERRAVQAFNSFPVAVLPGHRRSPARSSPFQFFPSCCRTGEGAGVHRREQGDFQFFPSCCTNNPCGRYRPSTPLNAFNSFPVAVKQQD